MHMPVMLEEVMRGLAPKPDSRLIDATLGGGGHAAALAGRLDGRGVLLGLDRDPEAIERAGRVLADVAARVILVHADYAEMDRVAAQQGLAAVDGILLDCGVSSFQLDEAHRGFSFQADGPLDMRMDPTKGETAAEFIGRVDETELVGVLRRYGEEPKARAIARAILGARERGPLETTGQLAELVERASGGRRGRIHPATRTFMALRMAVNGELESLKRGLDAGIRLLAPGGRMAVLSFHSLEDRLVKRTFRAHVGVDESLQAGGSCWRGEEPRMHWVQKNVLKSTEDEQRANPRSRSARLRVIEKD